MISIVVPTYKEADSLPALVRAVDAVMQDAGLGYELIISDDNSPDATREVCAELGRTYPGLSLIQPTGRDKDLSLSVIDGIRVAQHDIVVVMDADLSHPPETVPEMVAVVDGNPGAFVVGSRYISGGGFDRDWSLFRFLNSHVATLLARPLTPCTDPMAGFFAFHKSRVDPDELRPIGYKIGLELMVRGDFPDVREVPIKFRDREIGESKMTLSQQFKYLRHLRRLYLVKFGNLAEFFHYGAVGASGFVVDLAFYLLLQWLGIGHQLARALSFWPAVSWNWALNRITTFGERKRRPKTQQWFEFVIASLVGFTLNWGIYVGLTGWVPFFSEHRILAFIAGIIGASLFNFLISTFFVYSEKRIRQD